MRDIGTPTPSEQLQWEFHGVKYVPEQYKKITLSEGNEVELMNTAKGDKFRDNPNITMTATINGVPQTIVNIEGKDGKSATERAFDIYMYLLNQSKQR